MQATMNIRQAARWAERKDALYINGDFNNPMCAVWSSNTHEALCIGSIDKCRTYLLSNCDCKGLIPTTGRYYPRPDASDWLRLDALDDVVQGMDESEAEALLPERDYRHEGWAH